MVVALFCATIILIYCAEQQIKGRTIETLPAIMMMGALGGFVSALQRLYAFGRTFPSGYERWLKIKGWCSWLCELAFEVAYAFIPPVIGAIGAGLFFLLCASGLVVSSLLPKPDCGPQQDIGTFLCFAHCLGFHSSTDYAKGLVWGFIAGFSERFIPNILNQLANQAEEHASETKDLSPPSPNPETKNTD
jgi:hypothetical protein